MLKMITNSQYYKEQQHFIFGIFNRGKLIFAINKIKCTHVVASIIIGILNLGKESLKPGHYFACDFVKDNKNEKKT